MFLVALDFDGVLNTEQSYFYWRDKSELYRSEKDAPRLCPIAISNLNYLCEKVENLQIVISSAWRKFHSLENIKKFLEEDGFKHNSLIVGITPVIGFSGGRRYQEIKSWMEDKQQEEIKDWIAIDDNAFDIPKENLVLTKQEIGLTIIDVYSIIERFNPKWSQPTFLM